MISQFFVLSERGDNIVFRDYRGEVANGSAEVFFRKVKLWSEDGQEEAPPVFNVDGVNYFHVKVGGLLFVATTRVNVSPALVFELLQRIKRVTKDYLGILNEDSLRKNFLLVYELLDEIIVFGYVQTTSTEVLKSFVSNEPIAVDAGHSQPSNLAAIFTLPPETMSGAAATKSVVAKDPRGRKREDAFVDVIEKISVTFSASAEVILKVKAEFPSSKTANTVLVQMPLLKSTTRVTFELVPGAIGQTTDFKEANKRLEWGLEKIVGGSEHTLRAKLTFLQDFRGNIKMESGPVSMTFNVYMYTASKLKIMQKVPDQWVKYVTQAHTFVARI